MISGPSLKLLAGVAIASTAIPGVAAQAQSGTGNFSPKDFDLACAIVTGAEMGASQNEQNVPRRDMAITIFSSTLVG